MVDDNSRLDRRSKLFIAVSTLGILLLVTVFAVADLWSLRGPRRCGRPKAASESRAGAVGYICESSSSRAIRRSASSRSTARGPADPRARPPSGRRSLSAAQAALTGIGSLSVTDAEGIIRHSSQPAIIGRSRRDDYVFQQLARAHHRRADRRARRSSPSPGHIVMIIPFGRRLIGQGWSLLEGAVVATAIPEDSRASLQDRRRRLAGVRLGVPSDRRRAVPGAVAPTNPIGESAPENPMFQAAQVRRTAGTLRGRLAPDGATFISAFQRDRRRRHSSSPCRSHRDEVLGDWYHERNVTLGRPRRARSHADLTVLSSCSARSTQAGGSALSERSVASQPCARRTTGSRRRSRTSSARGSETEAGELRQRRVPDDRLARAAHAVDRDLRVVAPARRPGSCAASSKPARSRPSSATPARRPGSSTICSTSRA